MAWSSSGSMLRVKLSCSCVGVLENLLAGMLTKDNNIYLRIFCVSSSSRNSRKVERA